ncbi:MAG: GNAT family N-acetyltransferase [Nitratireductor sp.]|nr:GNAT family N-acetyltransferase [Nitratireductor sp.]
MADGRGGLPPAFIRSAMPSDVPAVRALLAETWHATYDRLIGAEKVAEITARWHSEEALRRRLSVPASEFLVADTGSALAAMAFASQQGEIITLHQLYVRPAFQRQGIASDLLRELTGCFIGSKRWRLEVASQNAPAIAFYRALGFSSRDRAPIDDPESGLLHLELTLDIPDEHQWKGL